MMEPMTPDNARLLASTFRAMSACPEPMVAEGVQKNVTYRIWSERKGGRGPLRVNFAVTVRGGKDDCYVSTVKDVVHVSFPRDIIVIASENVNMTFRVSPPGPRPPEPPCGLVPPFPGMRPEPPPMRPGPGGPAPGYPGFPGCDPRPPRPPEGRPEPPLKPGTRPVVVDTGRDWVEY